MIIGKIITWIKYNKYLVIFIIIIGLIYFFYFENNAIVTTNITVNNSNLPKSFDGFKIVHLSDLHGKTFGKDQEKLINKIKEADPDLIVFTGDLIDQRRYNDEYSLKLMKHITDIAPVYYVTGNHEWQSNKFDQLEPKLLAAGVKVLRNKSDKISLGKDSIYIMGIDDPMSNYTINHNTRNIYEVLDMCINEIPQDNSFKILLSHRPEKFSLYKNFNIDLIFSGHAHGGQIRLPFIGGILSPHQGFFPKYSEGKHINGQTTMIVSRGLGNSIFPQRLFNRPEIVIVTLRKSN